MSCRRLMQKLPSGAGCPSSPHRLLDEKSCTPRFIFLVSGFELGHSSQAVAQSSLANPRPMSRSRHMQARPPGRRAQAGCWAARVPQNCPPWRVAHCAQRQHIVQPLMWRRFSLPRRAQHGLPHRHTICTSKAPSHFPAAWGFIQEVHEAPLFNGNAL